MNRLNFLPARARRTVLANSLRVNWLTQLLILAWLATLLADRGWSWPESVGLVAGGWWLLQLFLLGFGFALKLVAGDWPAATRGPLPRALRIAAVEIGWMIRLYLLDHPWLAAPLHLVADDRRAPLLLVHGFLCNGAVWRSFARFLEGRSHAAVSLEPSYRHFERQLDDLHQAVVALADGSGRERVMLVGHSMGGLLVRAYAERHPERCAGVVCVAAPHHGTLLADYIYGVEAGPPSARCQWLNAVNQRDRERIAVPALNLWTVDDNIVIPARSAQLGATPERTLHGHGHLAAIAADSACPALLAAIDHLERQSTMEKPA
jgi:pimeloyl-ACP methyl ester carboxylesterase